MTYPATPGFQAHSDTSRFAAEQLTTQKKYASEITAWLKKRGAHGGTCGEARDMLEGIYGHDIDMGAVSALIRELVLAEVISPTPEKRIYIPEGAPETYKGRLHTVNVFGKWADYLVPSAEEVNAKHKENLYNSTVAQLRASGHGWIVERNDGRKECKGPNVCATCRHERDYLANIQGKENG